MKKVLFGIAVVLFAMLMTLAGVRFQESGLMVRKNLLC